MIHALFRYNDGKINAFTIKGHANAGEYGKDIVCSAVSSAAICTANTLTDIMNIDCKVIVKDGLLTVSIDSPSKSATDVLEGLRLHLTELSKDYSQFLTVTTEV
ncbi:MAG TPA: ribosomal-processing cysteine protease Prp [Clostridiales bacterium]|jgi:uncharacterized protein YsxB (DUF464 family)|nr:ribosomal-processing cysteine protease Prp [Clostridiales bacterium]